MPAITSSARLTADEGNPEPLRNGVDRPVDDEENGWRGRVGSGVTYAWAHPVQLDSLRVICDSDLNANIRMQVWHPPVPRLPPSMVRDLTVEVCREGEWGTLRRVVDNERRLIRVPVDERVEGVRLRVDRTWGDETCRLFAVTAHGLEG
jgi:hypothetical protein